MKTMIHIFLQKCFVEISCFQNIIILQFKNKYYCNGTDCFELRIKFFLKKSAGEKNELTNSCVKFYNLIIRKPFEIVTVTLSFSVQDM